MLMEVKQVLDYTKKDDYSCYNFFSRIVGEIVQSEGVRLCAMLSKIHSCRLFFSDFTTIKLSSRNIDLSFLMVVFWL